MKLRLRSTAVADGPADPHRGARRRGRHRRSRRQRAARAARRRADARCGARASARRCCRATWSALIEGGERSLDAARQALQWAADEGPDGRRRVRSCYPAEGLHFLPPVPRPPLLRDFMGFETHLRNIYPKLGREIPPEWYKIAGVLQGQPRQPRRRTATTFPIPSYATALDIEFELAMVIGRGGVNIPAERALRPRLRLHDLQRLQRADDSGPRNVGRPRPGQGEGLRARPRAGTVPRHRRRDARHLQSPDGRSRERRGVVRDQLRHDPLEVRADDRPRLDR